MADESQEKKVSLEELMVSTLAMTDALAKLMIDKGVSAGALSALRAIVDLKAVYEREDNAQLDR